MAIVAVGIGFNGCYNIEVEISKTRAEVAHIQKAVVAKVFGDNIDVMQPKAPNGESWGEWIMEVAGLDKNKWAMSSNGIYPIDTKTKKVCHDASKTPLIWINPNTGTMNFSPSKLAENANYGKDFCEYLRMSYADGDNNNDSGGDGVIQKGEGGDRIVPLDL